MKSPIRYPLALTLLGGLTLCAALPAQDMLAVEYSGQIRLLDSTTGQTRVAGVGMYGQNGMARDSAGRLWSTARDAATYYLTEIDPASMTATPAFVTGDLRALAAGPGTTIYAVEQTPIVDQLVRIDSATGRIETIGNLGASRVQAMTMHRGTLYVWDLSDGLLSVDPATGSTRSIDSGPGNIQWLATRSDGRLVGGGLDLRVIDTVTGATQIIASSIPYMRGAEPSGYAVPFGQGCEGGSGPVTLSVRGSLKPGSILATQSVGHSVAPSQIGSLGVLILGASRTQFQSFALPLSLDSMLGTSGCSLYASIDVTLVGSTLSTSPAHLGFTVPIPATLRNSTVYLQHAAFDLVQGGMSWSNGVEVRIGD